MSPDVVIVVAGTLALVVLAFGLAAARDVRRRQLETAIAAEVTRRDHEERTPRLQISVSQRTCVTFVNTGPQHLDDIGFAFVDGDIAGARLGSDVAKVGNLGPLPVGQSRTLEAVEGSPQRGGEARLRLTCRAGDETWDVGGYFEVRSAVRLVS